MKTSSGTLFTFICSALLVGLLALPTVQSITKLAPSAPPLYGYTEAISMPPTNWIASFFNKSLQRWAEGYYDANMGFRSFLIRSFNQINFSLFREAPRLQLISTSEHGLYSKMSIDHLNSEVINESQLSRQYITEAEKLLQIQAALKKQNKYFIVIIASSKAYVYPEGLGRRYLVDNSNNIFKRAANYGNTLKSMGVNVIDSGEELRNLVRQTGITTHPTSGVHWNYYAGCIIAAKTLDNIRSNQFPATPKLECGSPVLDTPRWVDLDGYLLLNIWSDSKLLKPSTYPAAIPVIPSPWRPKVVFIGDSFSDQIRWALQSGKAYERMSTSNYFRVREIDQPGNEKIMEGMDIDASTIHSNIMKDIAISDIVVLEMVDYNIPRWSYGFSDHFLEQLRKK